MPNIQQIVHQNKIIALIFRHNLKAEGVKFLTPNDYSLQLGLIEHPKNKQIRPHRHPDIRYKVNTTQEFIYLEKGAVEATFYDLKWKVIKKVVLQAKDFILCVSGGHSFRTLKPTRMIEIKQGPYPGDKKAKIFKD